MKSERVMWISVTIVVAAIAFAVGAGLPEPAPLVLGVVLLGLVAAVGAALSRWSGSSWMFPTIVAAFLVKLGGAGARLWVLQSLYLNVGDATGYHNRGLALAEVWRTASVPALTQAGGGSTGTKVLSIIAGLLYAPYKPIQLAPPECVRDRRAVPSFVGFLALERREGLRHAVLHRTCRLWHRKAP